MTASRDGREPVLDGVRGVAILLVLFHHFVLYSDFEGGRRLDAYMEVLGDAGWIGVDLFFVLSGFLITGILLDTKSSPRFFRTFYARRTLRIFPLYFGVLLGVFIVSPLLFGRPLFGEVEGSQVWYWTYTSNVDVALHGWRSPLALGHFWSLAVEEQFYLLWPLVVYTMGRRRLVAVTVVCFVTALLLRVGVFAYEGRNLAAYVLMPMRMDALAAGAFLALLVRGPRGWGALGRWPARVFFVSLVSLGGIAYWRRGLQYLDPVTGTIGFTVIATGSASLIALLVATRADSWARAVVAHPVLTTFGTYSYGLYVFHHIVVIGLRDSGFQARIVPTVMGSQLPGLVAFSAVGMALSWLLAYVSWHAWERPFLRLKRFFAYPRPPSIGGARSSGTVTGSLEGTSGLGRATASNLIDAGRDHG
jgi:peptidoglycan/LPS O-acetylase OafA/YrhL